MKKFMTRDSLIAISLWIVFTVLMLAAPLFHADAFYADSVAPGLGWTFLAVAGMTFFYM